MKKSDENLKKRILSNPIPEETNQKIDAEATIISSTKATPTTSGNSLLGGIIRRLVCLPNTKLPDDTSEEVFIPKIQPK